MRYDNRTVRVTCSLLCALTLATITTGALAPVHAEERASNAIIEEVVVVSRKRAEGEVLQETPISATAFSAEKIEAINAVNIKDLGRLVPGARIEEQGNSPGFGVFFIRGAGVSPSVPSFDPAVGVFVDGVYQGQVAQSILDVFDLESVEILRGPQGTLFGRNVTGGVVNARTKRPTGEYGINLEATVGSYSRRDLAATINTPMIADQLAAKLTIMKRDRDGYVEDVLSNDEFGEIDTLVVRPSLTWTPTDNFELNLLFERYEQRGDPLPVVPTGNNKDGTVGGLIPGGSRSFLDTWYNNPQDVVSFVDFERNRATLEMVLDLEHGSLTSITGYADLDHVFGNDFDGTEPAFIFSTAQYLDQHQWSQEIRYASSFSDIFDFTAGFYYFSQDVYYGEQRYQGSRVACCVRPGDPIGAGFPGVGMTEHDQWSVFFEAHYIFAEDFTLTVGARYGEEEKDTQVGLVNSGVCISDGLFKKNTRSFSCPGGYQIDDDETWDNLSPKVGLEWRINDDAMVYASWTRAFRSGGWTYRTAASDLASARPGFYDEEQVDAIEAGIKSDWFDNRLRVNIAGWQHDFDDLQRSIFLTQTDEAGNVIALTQRFDNVPDSEAYGFEVEVVGVIAQDALSDGDSLTGEFAWGNIEYDYNSPVDFNGDNVDDGDYPWNQIPDSTWNAALTYAHTLPSSGGRMTWRIGYQYTDEVNGGGTNLDPISFYQERDLWDASVRYDSAEGNWYVSVFGKNLGDEDYYQFKTRFASSFGIAQPMLDATWGATIGVSL